jgi:hypothetical protein
METIQVDDYAHRLYAAHGDKAEFEAAQKARACEESGDAEAAAQWRQVRQAIRILRGPNES